MKRFLSIFLTAVTLILCLCSCSRAELVYGEYESNGTGNTVYIKVLKEGKAKFCYDINTKLPRRADYIYNETDNTLTVQLFGFSDKLVFKVEEDKLIFVAEKSSGIEEDNGVPQIQDGTELFITKS